MSSKHWKRRQRSRRRASKDNFFDGRGSRLRPLPYLSGQHLGRGSSSPVKGQMKASNILFQIARAEYDEVLLSHRETMEACTIMFETNQQQLQAIVNTYQALGGGGF